MNIKVILTMLLSLPLVTYSMEVNQSPEKQKEELHELFPFMTKKEALKLKKKITKGGLHTLIQKPEPGHKDEFQDVRKLIALYTIHPITADIILHLRAKGLSYPCETYSNPSKLEPLKFTDNNSLVLLDPKQGNETTVNLNHAKLQSNTKEFLGCRHCKDNVPRQCICNDCWVWNTDKTLLALPYDSSTNAIALFDLSNEEVAIKNYLENELTLEQAVTIYHPTYTPPAARPILKHQQNCESNGKKKVKTSRSCLIM